MCPCPWSAKEGSYPGPPASLTFPPNVMIAVLNMGHVAASVYALAASDAPISPRVKEAMDVIETALDTHG
jgi:hypothetical protein